VGTAALKIKPQREFTRTVKVAVGIQARYSKTCDSLRILFQYQGVGCRETLRIPPTKKNIEFAVRLRGEVLNAIERGTFDYAETFPKSPRVRDFGQSAARITVGELLQQFLVRIQRTGQPSTYTSYRRVCGAHLLPQFGTMPLAELTPACLRTWLSGLRLTAKTVGNILIPLRAICEEAVNDDLLKVNPLERVVVAKLLSKETLTSDYAPDPFNAEEIQAILAHAEEQARNLFQFAFFTGLRPSELIALEWSDIQEGSIQVCRAVVEKKEKCTKTKAGMRSVILLPPALWALKAQRILTGASGGRVFYHPIKGKGWETDYQIREVAWKPALKKAGVRYRNPYQTRHTYASLLLSKGENMLWVAKQMGHRDTEMVIKTYGKWIPQSESKEGYRPVHDWGSVLPSSP